MKRKEPNKAMQPTPVDVTPCAVARGAPSTSVADLGRSAKNMKLADITFAHALTLGPHCDDGRVEFTIEPSAPRKVCPGVYFVLEGEEKLVYVGSYKSGVVRRWVYLRKKDLYHFKKPLVASRLRIGSVLRVFAQDEDTIKAELGCRQNVWVNAAGIEARLIAMFHPLWNNQGKKKPNQAPEPAPTFVTSRADARVAPAAVVAHL